VLLVIGSANSSNSKRLVEVSLDQGTPSYLIDDETEIDPTWFDGARTVGVTSGASAPEWLVERVVRWLREHGATDVEELRVTEEFVEFGLPRGVRDSDLAMQGANAESVVHPG
jgi:4-hydroxy-3-methylbut-2-enyl diphosphate reductase